MSQREPTVLDARIPGRGWYAAAIGVFLIGMAAFAVFLVLSLSRIGDGLTRIVVPGQFDMPLETGGYTVFYEPLSTVDGRLYSGDITGLQFSVLPRFGGAVVEITPDRSSRYSLGDRSGESILSFKIAEAGTYRVTAAYDGGRTAPQSVLALGQGFMQRLLGIIFGGLAIAFTGAIAAGLIFFIVYRKRNAAPKAPRSVG
jgi:hypothetical protein